MITIVHNKTKWIAFFMLCVLIGGVFLPVLQNEITYWDDNDHLTENEQVRSLSISNIKNIFTSTVQKTYIPLTILSFAVEYHFFEYNALVYHLNNLLLHMAITALVFLLALRMGLSVRAAFLGSLLFGIHPMHVESVAWITERKDVLYGFFYMLAVYQYWRYLESRRKFPYVLSVVFGLLSILAKSMALSLPLVLLLCDWFRGRKRGWGMLVDKIPYFLYIVPIAWITFSLNRTVMDSNASFMQSILIFMWSSTFYIKKFFFPFICVPIYEIPRPISIYGFEYALAVCIFVFVVISIVKFRRSRWLLFALFFYGLSAFFLWRFDDQVYPSWVADRFMYLPSLGICLYLGKRACDFVEHRRFERKWKRVVIYAVMVMVIFALGGKTYHQAKIWKDDETLWTYVLSKYPRLTRAYNNRGLAYKNNGQFDLASKDFNRAVFLFKNFHQSYLNDKITNRMSQAELEERYSVNSIMDEVYGNRGYVLMLQDEFEQALEDLTEAIELNPKFSKAYYNRGNLYAKLGKNDLALKDYNILIEMEPRHFRGLSNRAFIYINQNDYKKAIEDLSQAIEISPYYANAYFNRGICYRNIGEVTKAVMDEKKALSLRREMTDFGQK